MGGMWIVWLLLFALIVGLGWLFVRAAATDRGPSARESPEDILKRRYAAGEIDREEYERRLADIRG